MSSEIRNLPLPNAESEKVLYAVMTQEFYNQHFRMFGLVTSIRSSEIAQDPEVINEFKTEINNDLVEKYNSELDCQNSKKNNEEFWYVEYKKNNKDEVIPLYLYKYNRQNNRYQKYRLAGDEFTYDDLIFIKACWNYNNYLFNNADINVKTFYDKLVNQKMLPNELNQSLACLNPSNFISKFPHAEEDLKKVLNKITKNVEKAAKGDRSEKNITALTNYVNNLAAVLQNPDSNNMANVKKECIALQSRENKHAWGKILGGLGLMLIGVVTMAISISLGCATTAATFGLAAPISITAAAGGAVGGATVFASGLTLFSVGLKQKEDIKDDRKDLDKLERIIINESKNIL